MSHGKKRKKKNCPTQSCYEGEIIHRGQNCSVYLAVEYFLTWESVGIDCLLNQPHLEELQFLTLIFQPWRILFNTALWGKQQHKLLFAAERGIPV